MSNKRTMSRICYIIAVVSLVIGAAFHWLRMNPENIAKYNIGVTMGIVMIVIFVISLSAGIVLTIRSRREGKKED